MMENKEIIGDPAPSPAYSAPPPSCAAPGGPASVPPPATRSGDAEKCQNDTARRYGSARTRLGFLSGAAEITLLVLLLNTGLSRWLRDQSARPLPHSPTVVVLIYVLIVGAAFKLVGLIFSSVGRQIETRFGLNRQSWVSWWADQAKSTLLGGGLGLIAVELVYWLLRATGHWWLWAWAGFTVFSIAMLQLAPVLLLPLFYKFRPLSPSDPREAEVVGRLLRLRDRLDAEAKRGGRRLPALHGIYEWKLGEKSVKANAALTGWGASRRVLISDTLLAAAPVDELEAIFAHELGHHVHRDIWRGMIFQAAFSLLVFRIAAVILAACSAPLGLRGVADIAGLPLLLLVAAVLGLAALPAVNGFSRWMERRADDYSFAALQTAAPLLAGLERLARQNLAQVTPPRWKEWLLYSHPSIATRLRRGRAWMQQHGAGADGAVRG